MRINTIITEPLLKRRGCSFVAGCYMPSFCLFISLMHPNILFFSSFLDPLCWSFSSSVYQSRSMSNCTGHVINYITCNSLNVTMVNTIRKGIDYLWDDWQWRVKTWASWCWHHYYQQNQTLVLVKPCPSDVSA